MNQATKTNGTRWPATIANQLATRRKKLPTSWVKARGMLRDPKQIRALERHVRKVRVEWK